MQVVNSALQAELDKGKDDPRVLVDLYELYSNDAVPGPTGFDPADADETFAAEDITWNGIAYRRELRSRSDISRSMGEKTNSVTLNFSNISRYMATLAQTVALEGKILVTRTVAPSVIDDSVVLFSGRSDKPGDIDKKEFSLTARQDFGNINITVPTSQYVSEDPNGLTPDNPLYEGIRFIAQSGTFTTGGTPGRSGLLGALLGGVVGWLINRKKKVAPTTTQWSSRDFTPYGQVIAEVFGACQIQAVPLMFKDTGYWLEGIWAWCKGPIVSVTNITMKNFTAYGLYDVQTHTGEIGGTGATIPNHGSPYGLTPQTGGNSTEDFRFPGSGLFSRLAFSGISILQSGINDEPIAIDEPPMIVGLVRGRKVDLPDASGVYNRTDWSDNPVHISRFILTNDRFANINSAFMDDAVNYRTALHCDEPILDSTNTQSIMIPSVEIDQAGASFKRFQSSAVFTPETVKYISGDLTVPAAPDPDDPDPGGPYTPFDPHDIPTSFDPVLVLLKRYTANFPIMEEVKAVDLVNKTVFPTAKLFMRVGKNGKVGILSETAADSTKVRTSTAVGATAIPVLDATPWKTGPDLLTGRLLTGWSLVTSEVRDLLSADFSTSGNSLTLTAGATGTTTATASGATLSGGSTSVQASGTVTIEGTPAAGDVITATIDRIAVSYTLTSGDDTETAAAWLTAYINAKTTLKPYISASWLPGSPNVVTIKCKHGVLNLTSATGFPTLLKAHSAGEEVMRIAMSFATNSQDIYSTWKPAELVLLNDIRLPDPLNGHKYQATSVTTGITGTTQPTFPTTAGGTVVDGGVTWTEIGSTVLAQAGLKRANIVKDSFKWPLGSAQSSVNQIKGDFRDKANDFALTPFKVNDRTHQLQVKKIYSKEIDLTAVDNFHQVFRLANGELAKNREGDHFHSLTVGPQGLVLEEGDLIACSDDSGGLVNVVTRIEDLRIKPNHEVVIAQSRLYSTNMFSDNVTATPITIPSTLRYVQTADSVAVFIDNFAIRDADSLTPGFYIAVSRDLALQGDWRGWKLYADYGDGYVAIPGAQGDIAATMGTADTILDTITDATVFDTVSSLDFTLKFGTPDPAPQPFVTVTEADLIANPYKNLFMVGREYVQAATVVNHGNQSYTISDFFRGRFGTDGPELVHGADEDVIYLNGAEKFVAIDPARVGIACNYKVVTTNQNVSDATPISFTWTGGTIKVHAPTDFHCFFDSSNNNALMEWTGVTAKGTSSRESYDLEIRNAADSATLRPQVITPLFNTELSEIPPMEGLSPDSDYLVSGEYFFTGNGSSTMFFDPTEHGNKTGWVRSQAVMSPIGGMLVETEVLTPSVFEVDEEGGGGASGIFPKYFALCPTNFVGGPDPGTGLALGCFYWQSGLSPDADGSYDIRPEARGSEGNPHYKAIPGDRFSIEVRPDGTVAYYVNRLGPSSNPFFVSPYKIDLDEEYQLNFVEPAAVFGGTDNPSSPVLYTVVRTRWVRQGPEFLYTGAAQVIDGVDGDASIKARVRQHSFFEGGPPSAWLNGVFVR